jgi:hypothetical protein
MLREEPAMKAIQRVIHFSFATAALASASLPALSWTVWPDVDFEWYAAIGRAAPAESMPAPREGFIWAPGHNEWNGSRQAWVPGQWVVDDYAAEVARFATGGAGNVRGPTARDTDASLPPRAGDAPEGAAIR